LQYVENALRTAGQRLLLVETSGSADFKRTRAFYTKCGYQAEARVRDYYALGEDMVMFRKDLGNDNA
jgi:ribosomal protein S18 acetylase RimI-like enzyme